MIEFPSPASYIMTAPGAGAIGMIRVAGPNVSERLRDCLRLRQKPRIEPTVTSSLRLGALVDGDEVIDEVLICERVAGPSSVIDLTLHGGMRILERALEVFDRRGIPPAPSSHSLAAVWPAQTLIEIEALQGMIRATTFRAVRFLADQRVRLPKFLARLSNPVMIGEAECKEELQSLVERSTAGRRLAQGATVVLVGPPNSGKSTLFNRLVGRSAAVVSPIAGTTRDWVDSTVEMEGAPIRLMDTAGSHQTEDPLEKIAIGRAAEITGTADLVVIVLDGSSAVSADRREAFVFSLGEPSCLVVMNKADQAGNACREIGIEGLSDPIWVSAATGIGTDRLVRRILRRLGLEPGCESDPCLFTQRQARIGSDILDAWPESPGSARRRIRASLLAPAVESAALTGLE